MQRLRLWPVLALLLTAAVYRPTSGRAAPVSSPPSTPAAARLGFVPRSLATLPALVRHAGRPTPLADARGRVPVLLRLAPGQDARALGMLEVAPGIASRWVPEGELEGFVEAHAAMTPWVSPPLHPVLDVSTTTWTRAVEARSDAARPLSGKGVVVGVIDTGLDVSHADLRDSKGHTRVAWLLDLSRAPLGLHPEVEADFGCNADAQAPCAVLAASDIDNALARTSPPSTDVVGHGTHVASIAAGNGGLTGRYAGVAPDATLVVARVTRSSGESITDSDVLNAVRFVFDRARALNMPAVINLSLGSDYGPHDGTSPLEAGLAAEVGDDKPGQSIVVAAGNSGGLCVGADGTPLGAHTEARVARDERVRVPLRSPFLSGHVKGTVYLWVTVAAGDSLSIGLEKNGQTMLDPVPPGGQLSRDGDQSAAIINGITGGQSPIQPGSYGAATLIDGAWEATDEFALTLEGHGTATIWEQGTGGAELRGCAGVLFAKGLKQGTINVPASHPSLLSVGCTLNRTRWRDAGGAPVEVKSLGSLNDPPGDSACYFSSAGPNARGAPKPEISAPGGFVVAAMAKDASPEANPSSIFAPPPGLCQSRGQCLVVDQDHAISLGTSMSAPHVAGAIALVFEAARIAGGTATVFPTQPELVRLLQGGARPFRGVVPFDYQTGPGALDVVGALAAFDESRASHHYTPSSAASWVQLSVGYARPDGQSPIVGTVLLRDAEGHPADPADPSAVTLTTENAVVLAPPARRGPGVWEFTLAAPEGSGGQTLRLAIRYAGVLIGTERTLRIGPDVWMATGAPTSKGGCALPSASRPARASLIAGLGALAALVALGRTRRRPSR